jgi:hypothetical protein
MMQFARRASLVVVLLLFASVGTACAECAWVLWGPTPTEKYSGSIPAGAATIFGAYDSRDRCETERMKFGPGNASDQPRTRVVAASLTCLPDTVDPRGPKGK